jgi:hypothetical protein
MKPYVYKITGKNNTYYYGVRWNYFGSPEDDLLVKYFTSSDYIKEIMSKNGVDFFSGEIIKILNTREEALQLEYELIKKSINDDLCLNRAIGKCTIWDEFLLKKLSNSMQHRWEDPDYRSKIVESKKGEKNPNYMKPSWRNVNSDVQSWMKSFQIFDDYINESWDFTKYGFGRLMLQKRYDISQGTSRCLIKKIKNGWSPYNDIDFIDFYRENTSMAG